MEYRFTPEIKRLARLAEVLENIPRALNPILLSAPTHVMRVSLLPSILTRTLDEREGWSRNRRNIRPRF